jgi:phosphoglycerate dehydrogenase-like enzyme
MTSNINTMGPPHVGAVRTVAVGFAMPGPTFGRVFTAADLAALHAASTVRLLADRPLDLDGPADTAHLAEVEVLVTGWGSPVLDAGRLDRMPRLRAVVHSAGSIRPVVDDEVWRRGIAVASSATANAVPVAEFSVAMIVLAAKRALAGADLLRAADGHAVDIEGTWPVVGMHGITVGVVGASRVGRAVIERLRGYDVRVVLADPHIDAADAARLGVERMALADLCAASDIVSLHAPLLPSTAGMLDRAAIDAMRPGATLVNTARGGLVDQEALADRLDRGDLAAILDVTEPEVLPSGARLRSTPNTFITPHIAGSQGNELRRLAGNAVRETLAFSATGSFAEPIAFERSVLQA